MSGIRFSLDLAAHVANALHWLKGDLEATLAQARQALERHEEGPDPEATALALRLTREAAAVLDVARAHGAAVLATEVAATLAATLPGAAAPAPDAEAALAAAMAGLLGLSDDLDRLAGGAPDYAPQLADAIGEQRLAQGLPRLSGAELFARHVEALRPDIRLPDPDTRRPGVAQAIAAKLVGPFQTLLLAWLRGNGGDEALAKMARVAGQLSAQARTAPVYLAWSVFGVVAESLIGVPLDEPLDYRRLFGRMGQQLRWLAEAGEDGPQGAAARTGDVAWVLLYHLARVPGRAARAAALMASLEIDLVPADDAGTVPLRAPGSRLLGRVLAELQGELGRVKDAIDLAVRTGTVSAADRAGIQSRLAGVGQILLVLGLPHWQQRLAGQLARLPPAEGGDAGSGPWMETATLLLRLEHGLAEELRRPVGAGLGETGAHGPGPAGPAAREGQDLVTGRQVLAREALVNLARVKDAIDNWLRRGDDGGLDRVTELIGTAATALGVGGEEHGARLLHALALRCRLPVLESLLPEAAETERLADAIAAAESYLDALAERVPGRALALGQLDAALARLDVLDGRRPAGLGEDTLARTFARTLSRNIAGAWLSPEAIHDTGLLPVLPSGLPAGGLAGPGTPTGPLPEGPAATAAFVGAGEGEDEFRQVFLEEAAEVQAELARLVPRLRAEPGERTTLADVRRAFHTLKGSGRMVGATDIGAFGLALETMLNRCLEGALEVGEPVLDVLERAVGRLPALIAAFATNQSAPTGPDPLIERAGLLASLRSPELVQPDALAVFMDDAHTRLDDIRRCLAEPAPIVLDQGLVAPFHTLRGAAAIVNAHALSKVAGAVEAGLDAQRRAGVRQLSGAAQALLGEVEADLRRWLGSVGRFDAQPDPVPWLERLANLPGLTPPGVARPSAEPGPETETFAHVAADLVERFEGRLRAWREDPRDPRAPQALGELATSLAAQARDHGCRSLDEGATALAARLGEIADALGRPGGKALPTASLDALAALGERFYQFLDRFREEAADEAGPALVALAQGIPLPPPREPVAGAALPPPAPAAAPAAPAPAAPEPASPVVAGDDGEPASPGQEAAPDSRFVDTHDTEPAVRHEAAALPEGQDAGPAASVAETAGSGVPATGAAVATPGDAPPAERAPAPPAGPALLPAAPPAPPVALGPDVDVAEADAELLEIFLAEAGELADQVTAALGDGGGARPVDFATLRMAFHTLKGGARMVGLQGVGEAAHRLERQVARWADGLADGPWTPALGQHMARLVVTLRNSLASLATGQPADVSALLALARRPLEARAMPGAPLPPRDEDALAETVLVLPAALAAKAAPAPTPAPLPVPAAAPPPAPLPATAAAPAPALPPVEDTGFGPEFEGTRLFLDDDLPADARADDRFREALAADAARGHGVATPAAESVDPELVQIFAQEAVELLETLDASLDAWQAGAETTVAIGDIQRVLHTLKGGARMAGLAVMGERVHAFESRIEALAFVGHPPLETTFAELRRDAEELHLRHDALLRGDRHERPDFQAARLPAPGPDEAANPAPPAPAAAATESPPVASATRPLAVLDDGLPDDGPAWAPGLVDATDPLAPTEVADAESRRELARVRVETLDELLNQAGEISVHRARLERQQAELDAHVVELERTVTRLREQLRQLDIETEAQILARSGALPGAGGGTAPDRYAAEFDPLEMDRYSRMQEVTRALAESAGDLGELKDNIARALADGGTLLSRQGLVAGHLQQTLIGTLMVPFSRQMPRLTRVVRQAAADNQRLAELVIDGSDAELDRNVLDRIAAPLEHLVRNCVVHGIEPPEVRLARAKPGTGTVRLAARREGGQLLLDISDDGAGIDLEAVRARARARGLLGPDEDASDADATRFIFEPGFSTAAAVTQDAGRGVGMDVVATEVKRLGGSLETHTERGRGTRFRLRLPLTLAMTQALLVGVNEATYGIPVSAISGIARVPREAVAEPVVYSGTSYAPVRLNRLLGLPEAAPAPGTAEARTVPALLLVPTGEQAEAAQPVAVLVDAVLGNREIVAKPVGPLVGLVPGVIGATVLADGAVMLLLDLAALLREGAARARREAGTTRLLMLPEATPAALAAVATAAPAAVAEPVPPPAARTVMVVDDSITMRRVAERLLLRQGYGVVTARDGLEAIALLQTETPAAILLDIEMPRADGFEVASFVRHHPPIADTPIVMITSRSGDKHRARARALGVDRYLIKPYREDQLLAALDALWAGPAADDGGDLGDASTQALASTLAATVA